MSKLKLGDLVRPTSIYAFLALDHYERFAYQVLYPRCRKVVFLDAEGKPIEPTAYTVIAVGSDQVIIETPTKNLIRLRSNFVEVVFPPEPESPKVEPTVPTIEIETPSAPGEELPASVAGQKRRLTNVSLKKGSKRPSVILLQQALNIAADMKLGTDGDFGKGTDDSVRSYQGSKDLHIDGEVGGGTWAVLLNEATRKGFKPDLMLRIMEVITWYEVGGNRDAYGMAEDDIGDNAGANYSIIQANNYGSMRTLLKMADRSDLLQKYNSTDNSKVNSDIKSWVGSAEGIVAMNAYFKKIIFDSSFKYLSDLGPLAKWENDPAMRPYFERLILLLADSRVQNGGMFSSRRPFWKTLEAEYKGTPRYREMFYGKRWNKLLGEHIKYEDLKNRWFDQMYALGEVDNKAPNTNKALIVEMLNQFEDDPEDQLILLAQWRARTSSSRWWEVVEVRRMLDADGQGTVNGATLDLYYDFGIGLDA